MTTNASLSQLLDRLAAVVSVRSPASDEAIATVERRLSIRLSSDFRAVYTRLNGTNDAAPLENGWFELWPVERWNSGAP